jgi:hypothetical protein
MSANPGYLIKACAGTSAGDRSERLLGHADVIGRGMGRVP